MLAKRGKLFDRSLQVDLGIRREFHEAKDKHVTPPHDISSRSKDRVGPHTGIPTEVMPESFSFKPEQIVKGTPLQRDGTLLTKEASNVRPGPNSQPWFRRNGRNVNAGDVQIIINITVPQGLVYRLDRIGHTFHGVIDEFWIKYDGKLYNNSTWNFPLGTPVNQQLYKLPVTISATRQIQCFVRNNGPAQRAYEYFIDGWYDPIDTLHGTRT